MVCPDERHGSGPPQRPVTPQGGVLPHAQDRRLGQHHHRPRRLAEEVSKLRQGGDGYIIAAGGISFWRSLARLDLIDEYRVTLVPYLAGEGARLFENAGKSRHLDLLSSTAFSSGLQLDYRRHR